MIKDIEYFPTSSCCIPCSRVSCAYSGEPTVSLVSLQISFWLIENGFTVLIAACDTFRAGAVEQLRTHQRRLNSLHPPEQHGGRPVVQLYEKGYGKDAAGIAMEAIAYGKVLFFLLSKLLTVKLWFLVESTCHFY